MLYRVRFSPACPIYSDGRRKCQTTEHTDTYCPRNEAVREVWINVPPRVVQDAKAEAARRRALHRYPGRKVLHVLRGLDTRTVRKFPVDVF